jgi:asparagine synthase (glutamine-hydrolysing)
VAEHVNAVTEPSTLIPIGMVRPFESMDQRAESELFFELDRRFEGALSSCVRGVDRITVLFSGGVDSSIVALGLRGRLPLELLAIGVDGSRDLLQARSAAGLLDLPIRIATVTPLDVGAAMERHAALLQDLTQPALSVQVAIALAIDDSTDRRILVGQGADELFGGYAHFRHLGTAQLEERRRADWARLRSKDWPISQEIARQLGRELCAPFLDESFAEFALHVALESVAPDLATKPVLRRWALHRGLPESIAGRPKVAIQYGSGIAKLVDATSGRRATKLA